jgi:hypothetical protein
VSNTILHRSRKGATASDKHAGQAGLNDSLAVPQKPVSNSLVVDVLVDSALHGCDPVEALKNLQQDQRFRYGAGQRMILSALLEAERKSFRSLEAGEPFSDTLASCIRHRGELIDGVLDSQEVADEPQTDVPLFKHNYITDDICSSWTHLMTDELRYLANQESWDPDQRAMACHACEVLISLSAWWCREEAPKSAKHAGHAVVEAMECVVKSEALREVLKTDRSLEAAVVLRQVFYLSGQLGDPVLSEELIELLPDIFQICQELCPEDFSRDVDEDVDEDLADEEYFQSEQVSEYEDIEDDEQAEVLEVDSVEAQMLELQIEEAELQDETITAWEDLFQLTLFAFGALPEQEHRAEILLDVLHKSRSDSAIWMETLDTLIAASDEAFLDFLPELIDRALSDDMGEMIILSVADFSERTQHPTAQDPLPVLSVALRQLPKDIRRALLRDAKELLQENPELFPDPETTFAALKRLYTELKKPLR